MGKIKYVDLCAGIGGTRAGLDAAGWSNVHSSDIDQNAVEVHRLAHGDCDLADVTKMSPSALPWHDVLVAGFPCQPFSSSGDRSGFSHSSGSVFEGILRLIDGKKPKYVFLENVQGLLSNQFGFSFAQILLSLTSRGYFVEWATINTVELGVPQNRPRLIIIGKKTSKTLARKISGAWDSESVYAPLYERQGVQRINSTYKNLNELCRERNPSLKKKHSPASPFSKAGFAVEDAFTNIELSPIKRTTPVNSLGEICCPKFSANNAVRSVRYWAHTGKTEVYIKEDAISHCLGTSIGAPPIFCVPKKLIRIKADRDALMQHANWSKEDNVHFFFRLVPERAVNLFGALTKCISDGIKKSKLPNTSKYKLIGNLVSPQVAFVVAKLIEADMCKYDVTKSDSKFRKIVRETWL